MEYPKLEASPSRFAFLYNIDQEMADSLVDAEEQLATFNAGGQKNHAKIYACYCQLRGVLDSLVNMLDPSTTIQGDDEKLFKKLLALEAAGVFPEDVLNSIHRIREACNPVVHKKKRGDATTADALIDHSYKWTKWFSNYQAHAASAKSNSGAETYEAKSSLGESTSLIDKLIFICAGTVTLVLLSYYTGSQPPAAPPQQQLQTTTLDVGEEEIPYVIQANMTATLRFADVDMIKLYSANGTFATFRRDGSQMTVCSASANITRGPGSDSFEVKSCSESTYLRMKGFKTRPDLPPQTPPSPPPVVASYRTVEIGAGSYPITVNEADRITLLYSGINTIELRVAPGQGFSLGNTMGILLGHRCITHAVMRLRYISAFRVSACRDGTTVEAVGSITY